MLLVRPGSVVVDGDRDGVALGSERVLEKRRGTDTVHRRAANRFEAKDFRVGRGLAHGHRGLPARNRESLDHRAGGGLPQPIAHLVVQRLDIIRLDDVAVVAQAVEQLRAVGLRIDGLQLHALDVRLKLRTRGFRIHVEAHRARPDARHGAERPQVGERVASGSGSVKMSSGNSVMGAYDTAQMERINTVATAEPAAESKRLAIIRVRATTGEFT